MMHFSTNLKSCVTVLSSIYAVTALSLPRHSSMSNPTQTVLELEKNTWLENLAVRSNGQLMLTREDVPELYLFDPSQPNSTAALIQNFAGYTSLAGIAEYGTDKFAVIAGNASHATGGVLGTWSVWGVDMRGVTTNGTSTLNVLPVVHKIADVPQAGYLNGMSELTDNAVLACDYYKGNVLRIDTSSSDVTVVAKDPLMAAVTVAAAGLAGINGIHKRGAELYFTNLGQDILAKVSIDPLTGQQLGNASIISRALNSSTLYDDFTFDERGNFFLTTAGANVIERVFPDGRGEVIAGSLNSTAIAQPTAAQFGRGENDKDILYVTTAGGIAAPVDGDIVIGAQVVAVDLSRTK